MIAMLDLFCCEGVGAFGYDACPAIGEITGVDVNDMSSSYSWEFISRDAIGLDYEFLAKYQFIHASPPCQAYSKATPKKHKDSHPRLILPTRLMLEASGLPFVMENVEGSGAELRPNLCLSGEDVGLPMKRKRYFHVKDMKVSEEKFKAICAHKFGRRTSENISPNGRDYVSKISLINAYALRDMPAFNQKRITKYGIEQGIPPRMTLAIANILFGVW